MKAEDFLPEEAVIAGIRGELDRYEAERHGARRAVMWRVPVFDGLVLAAVAAPAYLFNGVVDPYEQWVSTPHWMLYLLGLVALFYVHARAMRPARLLQQSLRDRVVPAIFGFIEGVTYSHEVTPPSFARLPRETVGKFDRQTFDDIVTGRYEGFPFELYEAALRLGSGKSSVDVFKGIIVAFEPIAPFPGMVVAGRRAGKVTGFFRGLFGEKLQEIRSGNASLDEIYEFRTDNVEAALPLVTGRLAQALEWLRETWPENPSRVALTGSDGFLLIPQAKDYFELPGISQPLDYKRHVEPMVADMAALLATAALVRKAGALDDAPADRDDGAQKE